MMRSLSTLTQPLITRPAYGQGHTQSSGSELPSGGPSDHGLPLNSGIPEPIVEPGLEPDEESRRPGVASAPVAESGLPQGDPGGKGVSLSPDIPGEKTFKKPEDDIRDFDRSKDDDKDKDPWRRDSPDDQLKDRDRVDTKEDWGQQHDQVGEMGKGEWDTTIKTKYPYRDGLPHQHYASGQAEFVADLWLVQGAHELRVASGQRMFVATRPDDVVTGLNPKFQERAQTCGVTLKRADVPNLRWIFSVDCGNGPKVVKLKALRAKNVVRLGKMDIDVACSCPAWRWLGPEHHAKTDDYLLGDPRGTASTPVIRDPQGINRVCKHVAAVLSTVRQWEIPASPKKK